MKKYLLIILLGLSSPAMADVTFCAGGKCQDVNAQLNYPQIYTTIYGIFKNAIAGSLPLCDTDSNFYECKESGIRYFGEVGVSETNFSITGFNVIDTRINPKNRNLEIINDYYTYVNGRRVLCSAAMDVLSLDKSNVSLVANEISCPYNMQVESTNRHSFLIRLIDLDRKIIGLQYNIQDSIGADSEASGFALLSFKSLPSINFAEVNQSIQKHFQTQMQAQTKAQQQNMPKSMVKQPPAGFNYALPPQASAQNSSVQQQYQQQVQMQQQMMQQGKMPQQQKQGQFSYKSELPYPWGYYYAPGQKPQQAPAKKQIPVKEEKKPQAKAKNYTVGPLPKTMIEIDSSGNKVAPRMAQQPVPMAPAQQKTVKTQVQTTPVQIVPAVQQPAPAQHVSPVTAPAAPTSVVKEEYIGVFNEETFNNSVPK